MTFNPPSLKQIREISNKTHFAEPTVEKVIWQKQVLKEICSSPIGEEFALMGGSAIAFLFGDMYRLSVDLDMDFIANPNLGRIGNSDIDSKKGEHIDIINDIANSLKMTAKVLGEQDKRMLQIQLSYKSNYVRSDSVDLDLGYRYCHSVLDIVGTKWPPLYAGDQVLQVPSLNPIELWATQIVATIGGERIDYQGKSYLGSKRKIRHLYDTYYFAKNLVKHYSPEDLALLKKLVILFGATRIKKFELFRGDIISVYTEEHLDTELYPVIRIDMQPPSLIEMQRQVRIFLDEKIYKNWGDTEYRFFEDFSNNSFRPMDLFGDKKIARRLQNMYYYDEILQKVIRRATKSK